MPHAAGSTRIWKLIEERVVGGYVSAISFNNSYYLLRKSIGAGPALEAMRRMRRLFNVVALDAGIIDRAIAFGSADLEDAIQAASALQISAQYIVTRNVPDFANLGVSALKPEELLALLNA